MEKLLKVIKKKLTKLQKTVYDIRGQNVMIDSDLAESYYVETFKWNK